MERLSQLLDDEHGVWLILFCCLWLPTYIFSEEKRRAALVISSLLLAAYLWFR